jgi:hypothetical protein
MGQLTNVHDAPLPFELASTGNSWKPKEDRLYVTQLFAPPMVRRLTIDHFDEIENDVADFFYRILGSAVHNVCEKAVKDQFGIVAEQRVFAPKEWFGTEISGRIDYINLITNTLADIKTASSAMYGRGVKDEWTYQANIYRYLLWRIHGYTVDNLHIYPLYRDWSKGKAEGYDYPSSPYDYINLPVWSMDETFDFITKCVADHMVPEGEMVRFCTDEERWKTPDCYAVCKKGSAKAVAATIFDEGLKKRVPIETKAQAQQIINDKGLDKDNKIFIQTRKGGCRKCDSYCDVSTICRRVNAKWWASQENDDASN